ncbi:MAG TPA: DNA alkylation repair protein [Syntrophomonadaceae bacterium]|nr:DNA alkylation repair protein [Syntrophomonadaceae bacterium]
MTEFQSKVDAILAQLEAHENRASLEHMRKYGIIAGNAYGASIPAQRQIARQYKNDHELALALWDLNIHETRIIASMIDDPRQVTEDQLEKWVKDFYSWDLCDQCCANLFEKTAFAYDKAAEWAQRTEEYVKRAGFVMMARLAVSDKKGSDENFETFFPLIKEHSTDNRNFVKKAVNWALRQIGKRSLYLNKRAVIVAEDISHLESSCAHWIARDALRELKSEAVQERLRRIVR